MNIKFSIIIPAYNIENVLLETLDSLSKVKFPQNLFEVLIIDDQSTDRTLSVALEYSGLINLKVFQTEVNGGPGAARNIGIQNSSADYILFLDGDDFLNANSLYELNEIIQIKSPDCITFNWMYSTDPPSSSGRNSYINTFPKMAEEAARMYLGMKGVDGSIIFTCVKRELIIKHKLSFPEGFHEDIAFIFKVYYCSDKSTALDRVLYVKNNRQESIVNTFSKKHIDGALGAWPFMMDFLIQKEGGSAGEKYLADYLTGISGITSNLIEKTANHENKRIRIKHYIEIFDALKNDKFLNLGKIHQFPRVTSKDKMSYNFLITMFEKSLDKFAKLEKIEENIKND